MKTCMTITDDKLSQVEYLYGENVEVPDIPAEVILRRIELLDNHLEKLLEVHSLERDGARCNAVIRAKNFWLKINEVEN